MTRDGLWNVGQFLSVLVGALVAYQHSITAGVAVAFVCQLLVDIRREIHEIEK
jgi:hypothetical protein